MIEIILTLDYEIYGNGEGSLSDIVYCPTVKLIELLNRYNIKMTIFVEAAELEKMELTGSDPVITDVSGQIKTLFRDGHEIALHLHPQWYNAEWHGHRWKLDYKEYNLCTLPEARVREIVEQGISWLKRTVADPRFFPISFRAGNWLLQPTDIVAKALENAGIKIDTSVFKGGVQHKHKLDYRSALKNGYFWKFRNDVTRPDEEGHLIEIPIYTQMVPFWKMRTAKRTSFRQPRRNTGNGMPNNRFDLFRDRLRLLYPLKLDFCKMTFDEITEMIGIVKRKDEKDPQMYHPLVAIGHTKDLNDFITIEKFLEFVVNKNISVVKLEDTLQKISMV